MLALGGTEVVSGRFKVPLPLVLGQGMSANENTEMFVKSTWRLRAAALLIAAALSSFSQTPGGASRHGAGDATPEEKPEEGIPVTNALVVSKCGGCHTKDEKGNLSRISWERTTPEGWEEAIKRMVRLNGLTLTPTEARNILKYLSTYHGLAPEEAKPVMYIAEHRMVDETIPNENIRTTCNACHALGKAFSWRRSKHDWSLLANMHVAFFPQAEAAFNRNPMMRGGAAGGGNGQPAGSAATAGGGVAASGQGGSAGGGPGNETAAEPAAPPPISQPINQALEFLGKTYPLHTPEWSAWRARMREPKLAGRWLVSAYIPGRGKYVGELVVEPGAAESEFKTRLKLQSVKDGWTIVRTGQGLVYAGYAWRGRSQGTTPSATKAPDDISQPMREVMWFSPDQLQADGRWFWGEYQEFGVSVHLERASATPLLITADRFSLKAGARGQRVRLFGDNLPAQISPADLEFGAGVAVKSVVSHTPKEFVAEVDISPNAISGKRDIALGRAVLQGAYAVYDHVDYIKVTPETSIARLGSDVHPKGYQQFEAIGYQRGADDKPRTPDDVELGPVDVTWSVEEFYAVYGDDDKEYVGSLDSKGFFTPALDGPNPQRKFKRNNYGDVWAVATAKNEKQKDGKPLVGKSYLVVTVPLYLQWDQPEVGQ
ncbi:MAG TPA: quinohemoprotein amine dehydrogenase subunit alpha [Chthoniobacterales bacterium]|nr:quinohemoprotein amine dehydrogenase subunit alpha [Chthoniobacterales bacterium]